MCAVTSSLPGKALGPEFCCYSAAFPEFVLCTRQIRFEPMTVSLLEFSPPRTPSWLQHFTSATNQYSLVLSCMAVQLESVNWLPMVTVNYKSTVREFNIGVDSTSSIKRTRLVFKTIHTEFCVKTGFKETWIRNTHVCSAVERAVNTHSAEMIIFMFF